MIFTTLVILITAVLLHILPRLYFKKHMWGLWIGLTLLIIVLYWFYQDITMQEALPDRFGLSFFIVCIQAYIIGDTWFLMRG